MRLADEIQKLRLALKLPADFASGGLPPSGDLSVRKLEVLARCGLEYENRYVTKRPKGAYGGSTPEQRLGSVVHRALFAVGVQRAGSDETVGKKELKQAVVQACGGDAKCDMLVVAQAWEILRPVAPKIVFPDAIAFEEPVQLNFGDGVLWGQMDRLDARKREDDLLITDYKTSSDVRTQEALDADTQIRCYLSGLHQMTDATRITFRTWYLVPDVQVDVTWDADAHDMTLEWLRQKRREVVSTQHWVASPGRACGECPWQGDCSARSQALLDELGVGNVGLISADDELVLSERQRLKGREELADSQRVRIDEDCLRPRLAGGRKVVGGGLVASLRACRSKTRYPAVLTLLDELYRADLRNEADELMQQCSFDAAGVERWIRSLDSEREQLVRSVTKRLETPIEGGSYVEVRRS